jgi:hypothetical protein
MVQKKSGKKSAFIKAGFFKKKIRLKIRIKIPGGKIKSRAAGFDGFGEVKSKKSRLKIRFSKRL